MYEEDTPIIIRNSDSIPRYSAVDIEQGPRREEGIIAINIDNERQLQQNRQRPPQRRDENRHILSLNSLITWIKHIKGEDTKMATLILATALKIKGPLTRDNVCAVERVTRDDVPNDADRNQTPRNLSGVVQDADKVHGYFTQQQHLVESDMLVQRPNQGKDEMIISIRHRFATPEVDVIFLYYTGHGIKSAGDWAIARANGLNGFDTITLDEVLQLWENEKNTRDDGCQLIIIADSCYSGAWVEEINRRRESEDPADRNTVASVSMAASCKADETCSETPKGGDYTLYLLRPLRSTPIHTDNITPNLQMLQQPAVTVNIDDSSLPNGQQGTDHNDLDGNLCDEICTAFSRSRMRMERNCLSASECGITDCCDSIVHCLLCPCRACCNVLEELREGIRERYRRTVMFYNENKYWCIFLLILLSPLLCFVIPVIFCFCCCCCCLFASDFACDNCLQ